MALPGCLSLLLACASLAAGALGGLGAEDGLGAVGGRRVGWLDRAVLQRRDLFLDELRAAAPLHIHARIERAPVAYLDSPLWSFVSVARLLGLLRASESARPVHDALSRALRPTRRLYMSRPRSFRHFPSLQSKYKAENFHYDIPSEERVWNDDPDLAPAPGWGRWPSPPLRDDDVIVVSNPVEARLPSASISVRLLREILEARAMAARAPLAPSRTTSKDVTNATKDSTQSVSPSDAVPSDAGSSPSDTTTASDGTTVDATGVDVTGDDATGSGATGSGATGSAATGTDPTGAATTDPAGTAS